MNGSKLTAFSVIAFGMCFFHVKSADAFFMTGKISPNKCFDAEAQGKNVGTLIIPYPCHYGSNQDIRIEVLPNGQYQFRPAHAIHLCLDAGENTTSSVLVKLGVCDKPTTKWTLQRNFVDGTYTFVTHNKVGCLDMDGKESEIKTYFCHGGPTQRIKIHGFDNGEKEPPRTPDIVPGPNPSGLAPPTTGDDKWNLIFVDDFNGPLNGSHWSTHGPGFVFEKNSGGRNVVSDQNVSVHDGMLDLKYERRFIAGTVDGVVFNDFAPTTGWASLQNFAAPKPTYGKFEIRLRATPLEDVTIANLLWPVDKVWPPEIDFIEDFWGTRDSVNAFNHYRDSRTQTNHRLRTRMDEWHTWSVEWTPEAVVYLVDGKEWARDSSPEMIPNKSMYMGLMMTVYANRLTPFGEAHAYYDWVAVYSMKNPPAPAPARSSVLPAK